MSFSSWYARQKRDWKLASTSIRGRVALITTCLERAKEHFSLHDEKVDQFLDIMWTYCDTNRMDIWDEQVLDGPGGEFLDILEAYQKQINPDPNSLPIPLLMLELTEAAMDAGMGNLYSGVVGYSSETFDPTIKALKLLETHGIKVPDITPFTKSRFSEDKGWGNPVPRNFFRSN